MIIEFCGIPGGGKSTLAKAYAKSHASSTTLVALDMYKRLPEATYGILFAIRHPQTFFWLCVFVVRYSVRGVVSILFSFDGARMREIPKSDACCVNKNSASR